MSDFEDTPIQWQAVEAMRADTALRREDLEGYAERARSQRHHEVMLELIKVYAAQLPWPPVTQSIEDRVNVARKWADLSYPKDSSP